MRKRFVQSIVLSVLVPVFLGNIAGGDNRQVNISTDINNRFGEMADRSVGEAVAPVTVAGRVFNSAGVPLRSIRVDLIDTIAGTSRETFTSSLGWYAFPGVESGRVYQYGIVSSRYQAFFQPLQPSGDVFNADIITFQ